MHVWLALTIVLSAPISSFAQPVATWQIAEGDTQELAGKMGQNYYYLRMNLDELKKDPNDTTRSDMAQMFAEDLQKQVKEAEQMGMSATAMIEPPEYEALTLGQLKSMLPDLLKQAMGAKATQQAQDDAKWASFTKLLKGDRLAFFNNNHRSGVNVYTRGGRLLTKPDDFAKSEVMYTYSVDHDAIIKSWYLTGHQFKGDKLLKTWRSQGTGDEPPSSAFK